jgi:hypothetical protein
MERMPTFEDDVNKITDAVAETTHESSNAEAKYIMGKLDQEALAEASKNLDTLPKEMSEERRKNLEGKALMVLGPIIALVWGTWAGETFTGVEGDGFATIIEAVGRIGDMAIASGGVYMFLRGVKKYVDNGGTGLISKLNQFVQSYIG